MRKLNLQGFKTPTQSEIEEIKENAKGSTNIDEVRDFVVNTYHIPVLLEFIEQVKTFFKGIGGDAKDRKNAKGRIINAMQNAKDSFTNRVKTVSDQAMQNLRDRIESAKNFSDNVMSKYDLTLPEMKLGKTSKYMFFVLLALIILEGLVSIPIMGEEYDDSITLFVINPLIVIIIAVISEFIASYYAVFKNINARVRDINQRLLVSKPKKRVMFSHQQEENALEIVGWLKPAGVDRVKALLPYIYGDITLANGKYGFKQNRFIGILSVLGCLAIAGLTWYKYSLIPENVDGVERLQTAVLVLILLTLIYGVLLYFTHSGLPKFVVREIKEAQKLMEKAKKDSIKLKDAENRNVKVEKQLSLVIKQAYNDETKIIREENLGESTDLKSQRELYENYKNAVLLVKANGVSAEEVVKSVFPNEEPGITRKISNFVGDELKPDFKEVNESPIPKFEDLGDKLN